MAFDLNFDIVIVGGGLIGKASALAMIQSGYNIAILASSTEPRTKGLLFDKRIYAISSSSQSFFKYLCIWKSLDQTRLIPVYDIHVYGDRNAEIHFSAYQSAVQQLAWIAESSLIESTLDLSLRLQPNLTWFNAYAETINIQDDAAILTLSSGETIRADLIIGADGANSRVRTQVGLRSNRLDYGQKSIIANFKATLSHCETAYQWFVDGEIIALLPLPDDHVSLIWSASTLHANKLLRLDSKELSNEVERISHGQVGSLYCVSPVQGFELVLQTVDRLIAPHVALVGDAAHVIHPLAGQGMNLGLRDVATLTDIILNKEAFRCLGDITLLRRYERARRADIQTLSILTNGLQRLFSEPSMMARIVRNFGMAFIGNHPLIKRRLILEILG